MKPCPVNIPCWTIATASRSPYWLGRCGACWRRDSRLHRRKGGPLGCWALFGGGTGLGFRLVGDHHETDLLPRAFEIARDTEDLRLCCGPHLTDFEIGRAHV